jgi:peptidoglycan/xylan/chitin deacetylase (PgdA/CDA1 family)
MWQNVFTAVRWGSPRVFLPFYHAVRKDIPPHFKSLYTPREPAVFERDVQTFLWYFASADPFCMEGDDTNRPSFLLTFDDGLRSFKEVAWPILKKYEVRPIVFVNPGLIDAGDLMFRYKASALAEYLKSRELTDHPIFEDSGEEALLELTYAQRDGLDEVAEEVGLDWDAYVKTYRPYLSWDELRELADEGVYIGAHSMDHPAYGELSADEQIGQTAQSLRRVQDELGISYRFFSFPFSDHGVAPEVFDQVPMDWSFGTQKIKREKRLRHGQRLHMERPGRSAAQILGMEYGMYQLKRLIGRHKAKTN